VDPRAYDRLDTSQLADIPPDVHVIRAFSFDTQRHLAVRGRYLRFLSLPDRWVTWLLAAIPAGLRAIKNKDIDVIFTTFPIASAVWLGYVLHRLTKKPWVVDFRDSMTEDNFPVDPAVRRAYRFLESKAVRYAHTFLFTAPGTLRMYRQRYPELQSKPCLVIPNGYDEPDFRDIRPHLRDGARTRLLHSGLIYPWERDPLPFFRAVARLKAAGVVSAETMAVDLRACGAEDTYRRALASLDIADIVHLLPPVSYREALQEAADADALLLLQAACCDHQIPAKVYEYIRLGRPILALTSSTGDTAALLREVGGATLADIADEDAIAVTLEDFLQRLRRGTPDAHPTSRCEMFSRRSQAGELAKCLSALKESKA
jgi:glycosyltransferase involved in cell wall biosynthesis